MIACTSMARLPLQRLLCLSIACVVWPVLHAGALHAQTEAAATAPEGWDFQYDLFQVLLERQGLAPVARLEDAFSEPNQSVIVIAGDPAQLPVHALGQLAHFVEHGGALLLATDHPWTVPRIARFAGGRVTSGDSRTRYHGFADCVEVTAIAKDDPRLAGISTIVTNRSSWLKLDPSSPFLWDVGAAFPENSLPTASRGQPLLVFGNSSDRARTGIVILSADASLLTNGMLWHGDNAILAIRVSSYLAGTDRTRLAFWADGQMLASLRNQLDPQASSAPDAQVELPIPEPDLQRVLKLANAVAREVAQSNVLNETLKQRPRHQNPAQYFRWLLVAATAAAFLIAVWVLTTTRGLRPLSAGGGKATKRTFRSTRGGSMLEPTDFRNPACSLAREFCWELTGSRHSTDWQKYLAKQLVFEPSMRPSDQQDLARIIDIASRGCREQMTASDFEQLGKTIAVLRAKRETASDAPHQPTGGSPRLA